MEKNSDHQASNVVQVDFKSKSGQASLGHDSTQLAELSQKKYDLFGTWVRLGTVCVLFDARHESVKVPPEFKMRGDLRLNFCYNFRIADFNFNATAVFGTLSFDDGEYFCSVPWSAIYGLQSLALNQGAVWFLSFPTDYDQTEVLGFSEAMCEEWAEEMPDIQEKPVTELGNVINFDFSAK